jgi:hypothetical protein
VTAPSSGEAMYQLTHPIRAGYVFIPLIRHDDVIAIRITGSLEYMPASEDTIPLKAYGGRFAVVGGNIVNNWPELDPTPAYLERARQLLRTNDLKMYPRDRMPLKPDLTIRKPGEIGVEYHNLGMFPPERDFYPLSPLVISTCIEVQRPFTLPDKWYFTGLFMMRFAAAAAISRDNQGPYSAWRRREDAADQFPAKYLPMKVSGHFMGNMHGFYYGISDFRRYMEEIHYQYLATTTNSPDFFRMNWKGLVERHVYNPFHTFEEYCAAYLTVRLYEHFHGPRGQATLAVARKALRVLRNFTKIRCTDERVVTPEYSGWPPEALEWNTPVTRR